MGIDLYTLKLRQGMDLENKIRFSKMRIQQWIDEFGENGVYVSFSGGKDSTVLLDLVRSVNPNIKAMFVDTGLEFPEIRNFVKTYDNVDIIRPKTPFKDVLVKYGYPIISKEVSECIDQARKALVSNKYQYRLAKLNGTLVGKDGKKSLFNCSRWKFLMNAPFKISNQCCTVMKKTPAHAYYRQTGRCPILGNMAEESRLRTQQYLKQGCNGFHNKIPTSTPLAFWKEQDILEYCYTKGLKLAEVYGEVIKGENGFYTTMYQRTGCMFCGYGCHLEENPNRFEKLKLTHPKQYDFIINTLGFGEVLDFIKVKY